MNEHVDDPLLERVRQHDPARGLRSSENELRLLLTWSIAVERAPRRRGPVVVGLLLALLALGVATPAIAAGVRAFIAQTGWIGTSPNPPGVGVGNAQDTESDDSEWIDTLAPDFVDFAVSELPVEISLPPAYDLAAFARIVATDQQSSLPGGGYMQLTNVQHNYETHARCLWIDDWLDADSARDPQRADAAAAVLTASATWPATVASDGGGIVDSYRAIADAARAGERGPVAAEFEINCPPMPDGISR